MSGARRDNLETFVLKLGYDAMTELIGSSFINGVLTRQSPLNPAKFLIVESRSTTSLTDPFSKTASRRKLEIDLPREIVEIIRNDIFLIAIFRREKFLSTLSTLLNEEREREFGKDIRADPFDWKSNWVGGRLAVFPPSEIVMENPGSSKLGLAGVERNKNVPFRQQPDERNWNAGEEEERRRRLDSHAPRESSERCGNGWNIDTSGTRRTLYLPVPAPGFLYDLYTSPPLPPAWILYAAKVIYIRGGHLGTTFDWQEITRPTRESESFRSKCYSYSPHPSNNSMESPLHGIPNHFLFNQTHRIRTFTQNPNWPCFFFFFTICNNNQIFIPIFRRWNNVEFNAISLQNNENFRNAVLRFESYAAHWKYKISYRFVLRLCTIDSIYSSRVKCMRTYIRN